MASLPALILALLLPVALLLLAFGLLLHGWKRLESRHWPQGCACMLGAMALGVGALSLTRLAENPQQLADLLQWVA